MSKKQIDLVWYISLFVMLICGAIYNISKIIDISLPDIFGMIIAVAGLFALFIWGSFTLIKIIKKKRYENKI